MSNQLTTVDDATLAAVAEVLGCKPEWLRHVIEHRCDDSNPDLHCQLGVMWCCRTARETIGWAAT